MNRSQNYSTLYWRDTANISDLDLEVEIIETHLKFLWTKVMSTIIVGKVFLNQNCEEQPGKPPCKTRDSIPKTLDNNTLNLLPQETQGVLCVNLPMSTEATEAHFSAQESSSARRNGVRRHRI